MAADKKYNDDELNPPSWLDEGFFLAVLRQHERVAKLSIRRLQITPGSKKGDHYASIMFRVAIEYALGSEAEQKSISLILKTLPEEVGHKRDMLQNSPIFDTEINAYSQLLPEVERILRSIGDTTTLCPPCLYHSLSPHKVIIFEDMLPHGYEVVRDRFLTLPEVHLAYQKVAKLHAVTYKMLQERPQMLATYRYGMFSLPDATGHAFFTNGLDCFLRLLQREPELGKYLPYFESIKGSFIADCKAGMSEYWQQPEAGAYYALCHGDFHLRNMLFTYRDGLPDNCVLIDFQISYVGPIANDLIYSIYMLLTKEMRLERRDELIHYYFNCFIDTLKKLQFKGALPKLIEFRKQIQRHRVWELFLLYSFLPMMHMEVLDAADLFDPSGNKRDRLYNNPTFIAELKDLLEMYLRMGYLENLC